MTHKKQDYRQHSSIETFPPGFKERKNKNSMDKRKKAVMNGEEEGRRTLIS